MNVGHTVKVPIESKMKARELLTKINSTNNRLEELLSTLTNAVSGLLFEKLSFDLWKEFFINFKELLKMNVMDIDFIIDFMRALEHATIVFKDAYEEQEYWENLSELGTIYERLTFAYER